MMTHKETIDIFFTALGKSDVNQLFECYTGDIIYSDPLFGTLQDDAVKARWQLFCSDARNLSVEILNTEEIDESYATCQWRTRYFSLKMGVEIQMIIKSYMKIVQGKITEHSDAYRLSRFLEQVYGCKGKLLGWTGAMQRRICREYQDDLARLLRQQELFPASKKRKHISDSFDQ